MNNNNNSNNNNNNNSITKNTKDNVMFYIAPIPIMQPHIMEPFCEEDQDHWGQFVDIDPTAVPTKSLRSPTNSLRSPTKSGCFADQVVPPTGCSIDPVVPMNQKKKPHWNPRCDTIKEAPIEMHEHTESWHKEYTDQTRQSPSEARPSVCSHFEFLGKFVWSLIHTITFIDYPIPITNTEEPHPQ